MESPLLLRKQHLSILQDVILPDMQRHGAKRLILADLPLRVPEGVGVRQLPIAPLKLADAHTTYPRGIAWEQPNMNALQYPRLHCVVQGNIELIMGVTTVMLQNAKEQGYPAEQCGGYAFSLQTPSYLLVPAHVPWSREQMFLEANAPAPADSCTYTLRILPIGALCHVTELEDSVHKAQYSLLVRDDKLAPLMEVLQDELASQTPCAATSGALFLALMLRLQQALSREIPYMTDGLYSRFPESSPDKALHHPVIQRVYEYIRLHLHEPLKPEDIAMQVRLSPSQLNRILKKHAGLTTMEFVLQLRMEVAQLMLETSSQSVQEIACLTGYPLLSHFSRVFQRYTGQSPSLYRQSVNRPPERL
jgi:AraC-like DNA-binding protein